MRTPLIAATAAALSALAVTVAGAAFGGGAHGGGDADVAALRACLADHGATVPAGDARALKEWIAGDHTTAEKDAMKACGLDLPQAGGPDDATLRACLAKHGATVPAGDGAALKRWIIGTHTSAETDALAACGVAPAIKAGAPCDPRQPGGHASRPPGPGDKPGAGPAKPTGTQTSPST